MSTSSKVMSWYLHPTGRWFLKDLPAERRVTELHRTWSALAGECGHEHPATLVAGSWAAIAYGAHQDVDGLPTLLAAEPVLRERCHIEADTYALACNLAAQAFAACCLESREAGDLALAKMEEAVELALQCPSMHPVDVLRLVEALAEMRNGAGQRADATRLLYYVRDGLAEHFASYPRECYDVMGLWVEYIGDQQLESLQNFPSETRPVDLGLVRTFLFQLRAARQAGRNGEPALAKRHFKAAALKLMNNPQVMASTSSRLAIMLVTQATKANA